MAKSPNKLIDQGPLLEATGLVHRVGEPHSPGPHPTVVMLHGRFGNEEVMWIFERSLPRQWLRIAPRAIRVDPRGGYSWLLRDDNMWPELEDFDDAVEATARFIHALPALYNADPDRLYLMGFSQGAALSYATALAYPGLVQGVAGLVGFVPEFDDANVDLSGWRDLPIFAAVGLQDALVPYERAQHGAERLRASGAQVKVGEYDTGHKLNAQGLRDLTSWWVDVAP